MIVVRDPGDLYEVSPGAPELDGVVMLHYLDGFIDAGAAGKLLSAHLLGTLEHQELVRVDGEPLETPAQRPGEPVRHRVLERLGVHDQLVDVRHRERRREGLEPRVIGRRMVA